MQVDEVQDENLNFSYRFTAISAARVANIEKQETRLQREQECAKRRFFESKTMMR